MDQKKNISTNIEKKPIPLKRTHCIEHINRLRKNKIIHWLSSTRARYLKVVVLLVVAVGLVITYEQYTTSQRYIIPTSQADLLPLVNKNLNQKIRYSGLTHTYQFNKQNTPVTPKAFATVNPANQLQAGLGGAKASDNFLYSVNVPTDAKKGITYIDNSSHLSFRLTPTYSALSGKIEQGRFIYPIEGGGTAVYTAMSNGLKEDVIDTSRSQVHTLHYHLDLPTTLQAHLVPGTNELGIYSADPALFGNITYGDAADKAGVMKARLASKKNHLVFILPPPIIKQSNNKPNVNAQFKLNGNDLAVVLPNTTALTYPISIDPSVVIASSAAFAVGNNDDNISYPTNEIQRTQLSGGTVSGGWTQDTNSASLASLNASTGVAYNGYLYVIGGYNGTASTSAVYYTSIGSGGAVGAWTIDTAAVFPVPISSATSVEYNGYIYVMGGLSGTTYYNTSYYAQVTSAGTLSTNTCGTAVTWCKTSIMPNNLEGATSVVYNGSIYLMGGYDGTTRYATTNYAVVNANGSLGSWTTSPNNLPQGLDVAASIVYNNYVYVIGGYNATNGTLSTVYYTQIQSGGGISPWATNVQALPQPADGEGATTYGGYIYVIGGYNPTNTYLTTVYFAAINTNGSTGVWSTTSILPQALSYSPTVEYNGYIYLLNGANATSAYLNTTYYGKVDPVGELNSWTTTNGLIKEGVGKGYTGRENNAVVAYNGYIYSLGGDDGTTQQYDEQAPINNDGTLGAWAAATQLPSSYTGIDALTYNNYMYIFNGCSAISAGTCGTHTVAQAYSAPISSTGTIGSWTSLTAPPTALWAGVGVQYNGYVYLLGGVDGSGNYSATVSYAQLTTSGGLATNAGCGTVWCGTGSFTTGRAWEGVDVSGGYIYLGGGTHATSDTACNPTANVNCSDVQYAQITSSGALSTNSCGTSVTWCATTSLPNPVTGGIYISKEYVYSDEGYYAPLNSSGTVGPWSTTTTFATARTNYGSAINNGNLYIVAGNSAGTYDSDAQYTFTNNGGSGGNEPWNATTALPIPLQFLSDQVVTYNNYIYVLGGNNTSNAAVNTVYYAQITSSGALSSNTCGTSITWCNGPILPSGLQSATANVYNGYIYYFEGTGTTTGTYYAQITSSGALSSNTCGTSITWCSAGAIPGNPYWAPSVVNQTNGYVYILGGAINGVNSGSTSVLYAQITSSGPLAANSGCGTTWCNGPALPQPIWFDSAIETNGYVYVFGGDNNSSLVSTVYVSAVSSTGSMGAWQQTTSLPYVLDDTSAQYYDGFVYIVGGYGGFAGNSFNSGTIYAPVLANGLIGSWSFSPNPLQYGNHLQGAVFAGGYEYQVGGYDSNTGYTAAVYDTALDSIPRIGHYSDLLDIGDSIYGSKVTSITYNGSITNGLNNISYETAGTNAVLSTPSTAAYLAANPPVIATGCSTGPITEYVWLYITLDDTQTSTFPDSSSQDSYSTNITVNYNTNLGHPPPNLRLHGGKWFNDQILQPLDTCKP